MKKRKKKSNQNIWFYFIILFLIFQLIKFGINNEFFTTKQNKNKSIKELNPNICKVFSLSSEECNLFNKTGKLPNRVTEILNKKNQNNKITSNSNE